MFRKLNFAAEISIIGKAKSFSLQEKFKSIIGDDHNIKFPGYISERRKLIDAYDSHNILILPSYTEGQPYVVDEALARRRPVLIFEDISHIIKGRKGIFISKRDINSFSEISKYIFNNYKKIQEEIGKNKFPLEKNMFKQISDIISKN